MHAHKHEHALPCQTCVCARLEALWFRPGLLDAFLALCATLGPVPQVSTCSQLEPLNGTQSLTRWRVIAMNATLAVRPNAALIETARNETARRVAGATALDVGATLAFNGTNDTSVLPTIFTAIVQAVVCSLLPTCFLSTSMFGHVHAWCNAFPSASVQSLVNRSCGSADDHSLA